MNQALNNFQLNGGALISKGQSSGGMRKDSLKDEQKTKAVVPLKTQSNILKSVGLETLTGNKVIMPKISVIHK